MTGRQGILLGFAALVVGGGGFVVGAMSTGMSVPFAASGSPAPDFDARTLDSIPSPRHIAAYRGEVVLLNLWATWCGPCKVEMPSIQALHEALGPKGLKVVAISVDDPGNENRIRRFVADYGLTFEVLNEGSGRIEVDYQSPGIPATFLIDRKGIIRKRVLGAADWNTREQREMIEKLLASGK